jgi:hypothetical protein
MHLVGTIGTEDRRDQDRRLAETKWQDSKLSSPLSKVTDDARGCGRKLLTVNQLLGPSSPRRSSLISPNPPFRGDILETRLADRRDDAPGARAGASGYLGRPVFDPLSIRKAPGR